MLKNWEESAWGDEARLLGILMSLTFTFLFLFFFFFTHSHTAAQVTVKSYEVQGCHHAYTVEVKNQYELRTPFNSTHSTKAPSMGDSAVILTRPSHCTQCPKLEVSKTYLISGPYSRAADGSIQWKLGDSKPKALVSEWVPKYDNKLASFVSGGNRDRENNSKFFQQCETDSLLVSAEQWINL